VRSENLTLVKLLLAKENINVNQADNSGKTPLIIACKAGDLIIVELLLAKENINVNQADNSDNTPLLDAVHSENLKLVELLLANKNINVPLSINGKMVLNIKNITSNNDIKNLLIRKFVPSK